MESRHRKIPLSVLHFLAIMILQKKYRREGISILAKECMRKNSAVWTRYRKLGTTILSGVLMILMNLKVIERIMRSGPDTGNTTTLFFQVLIRPLARAWYPPAEWWGEDWGLDEEEVKNKQNANTFEGRRFVLLAKNIEFCLQHLHNQIRHVVLT